VDARIGAVPLTRRAVLAGGLAAAAGMAGCADRQSGAWGYPAGSAAPAPSSPPAGASSSPSGPSSQASPPAGGQVLAAPYSARLVEILRRYLVPTPENPGHPGYAGAVVLVMVDGRVTTHAAVGHALRYGAGPVDLAERLRVAMRPDSVFDVASLTKVFTTLVAMRLADRGKLDLAAPVVSYLPGFDGPGKAAVTVSMLLAHSSGLPVGPDIAATTRLPDTAARWASIVATPLASGVAAGGLFRYSSLNLLVLQQILEKLTGQPLDQLVGTEVTGPLGLRDTGFTPLRWLSPADRAARLVATDARSSRGLLRGVVHDEIADALGGVAGSAGIFTTAADLAAVGQLILDGGRHSGNRLLSEAAVGKMTVNVNGTLPALDDVHPGRSSSHGLGLEVDQPWFMGRLTSPRTSGHTGFTGTELVVEPRRRLVLVLLTNRAHPNWSWANPDPTRVAVANALADAIP
jgi:CubicO group peptidase (beta-lactamase class C family)